MRVGLLLPVLCLWMPIATHAQHRGKSNVYDDYISTKLFVATDLQKTYAGLEKIIGVCSDEKHYALGVTCDYFGRDTVFELLRVDSCLFFFENPLDCDRYLLCVNKGLDAEVYPYAGYNFRMNSPSLFFETTGALGGEFIFR